MMEKIHLIMPMGGAGSRFLKDGYVIPKPLIEINGKPFLYWSTMSIKKYIDIADLTFVVLQQHIDEFHIDEVILEHFSDAKIVVIPNVLPGPVLTCLEGVKNIDDKAPIIFNDCDHMFRCAEFNQLINNGELDSDGALLTFLSDQPQFSYVKYDDEETIIGTIEKEVVSNHAICGAYTFRNAHLYRQLCESYLENCQYSEYFISGLYNEMCNRGLKVKDYLLDFHVTFGIPEEYEIAKDSEYFKLLV